jgi:hypothetical protein
LHPLWPSPRRQGGPTVHQINHHAISITTSGNRVKGNATISDNTTDDYTITQSGGLDSSITASYQFVETGSASKSVTTNIDGATGNVTISSGGSDDYTITETGVGTVTTQADDTAVEAFTFTQIITGNENLTGATETGNLRTGKFERSGGDVTGNADVTLTYVHETATTTEDEEGNETTVTFTATTTETSNVNLDYSLEGNYNPKSGSISLSAAVADTRYGVLQYFANGAQTSGNGQDNKGTLDLSPFGPAYTEKVVQPNPVQGGHGTADNDQATEQQASARESADTSMGVANEQSPYINGGGLAQPVGGLDMIGANRLDSYVEFARGQYLQSCFRAGTPIRTGNGAKVAEDIQVGDELWSRSDFDPNGPLELKTVEERYVRVAPILNLHIGGQVIGTTPEHPFYVEGKEWLPCKVLQIGDRIRLAEGWGVVEGVAVSGEVVTVYNWRVAEFHTYFVGGDDWAFAVWAHNSDNYWNDFQHQVAGVNMSNADMLTAYNQANAGQWNAFQGTLGDHGLSSDQIRTAYHVAQNGTVGEMPVISERDGTTSVGNAISITGTPEFQEGVVNDLRTLEGTPTGERLFDSIDNSGRCITIQETTGGNGATPDNMIDGRETPTGAAGPGTDTTIDYNPNLTVIGGGVEAWMTRPPEIGLGHELIHAAHLANGELAYDHSSPGKTPQNYESQAVGLPDTQNGLPVDYTGNDFTENGLRADLGEPLRPHY